MAFLPQFFYFALLWLGGEKQKKCDKKTAIKIERMAKMSHTKKTLSFIIAVIMVISLAVTGIAEEGAPTIIYTNGVDGSNWGDNYAYINTLAVSGAEVYMYEWKENTCTLKLAPDTAEDAALELTFTIAGRVASMLNSLTLNGNNIKSAKKGTLTLENGTATATIYVKGVTGAVTKTINIEVASTNPPVCLKTEDSFEGYASIENIIDVAQYFENAENYYLVLEDESKEELEGDTYTFIPSSEGTYTFTFTASNAFGDCTGFVTVTAEIGEITGGVWLGIETSKGSVNFVQFTNPENEKIEGLTVSVEDKTILVNIPRDYDVNGNITASFNLTQTDGFPFLTTKTGTSGTPDGKAVNNKFTQKTTALKSGSAVFTFYLYNSNPSVTSNNYTTYTINYAIENEIPTLAEGQEETASAQLTAGEAYTLDLSSVFDDADGDELSYLVEINGEEAVPAEKNFSFTPTVGGTYTLRFFAKDFISQSEESYTVTLDVANSTATYDMTVNLPSDITPVFYASSGYDENGNNILGEELTFTIGETVDAVTAYTVSVPENIFEIAVRDENYGGMSFAASSKSAVTLCKVESEITEFGDRVIDGTVSATYDNHKAVGVDGKFLLETGKEYVFSVIPSDTSKYNSATKTVLVNEDTTVSFKVSYKNPKTIIATTGADVKLFKYSNHYFAHTIYEPLATVDNGDGTSTHYFAAEGDLSYRVSMDGKLTKAGYLTRNSATVLYTEDDALPTDRVDYFSATSDASNVAEDSILLNINQQNHLSLSLGETKTLKGYRAWEIINNHMNHIIQPDFNFNIISGEDVVELTPYENQPMTNSSGNWCTLTAIGEGTAIVEVTYDAIMIDGGSYGGFYGATDEARTGLFVVTAGENVPDVDFGIECKASVGSRTYNASNKKVWDSEFDTLYFLGESGEIKLSPAVQGGTVTEVAVSGDKGETYTILEETDGVYTAPIVSGNNIIRVTTDLGVAYQIVRGDKIELVIKNLTNPDNPIERGDEVSVQLVGLHTPIPKISGTYNPGYSGNTEGNCKHLLQYTFGENAVVSEGVQYDFARNGSTIKFTMPSETEETQFTLTDGYIGFGVIGVTGFSDDGTSHRNISTGDSGTRGNETTFTTRSILPDITVSVGMLPSDNTAPYIRDNAPKTATLNLGGTYAISMSKIFVDRDNDAMTYTAKINEGEEVATDEYYTFTPSDIGTYTIVFKANDSKADSDEHIITLTVKEKTTSSSTSSLEFDIEGSEIAGYVKISFVDKGKRVDGETNVAYPNALGTIISSTQVPFKAGDTVADVTLRLLDAKGYTYQHTGTTKNGFYLASIGDFEHKGIEYDSFGEFDAGSGSGWMITLNKVFIQYGASEFEVANGDVIKWQYTCQLGADIGDDFYTGGTSSTKKEEEKKEEAEENPKQETFTESTFTDVKKDDWHYESVKYVFENNLMQGTGSGFEPESKMSRAMLVTVLYRMANPDKKSADHNFADVPAGQWYSDAIAWAAECGIVNGVSETQFAPNSDVSREQMALIIYRFAKMQGYDISEVADITSFEDTDEISDFARDAIAWANKNELVNGTSETTLSPKDTATRAQVATILMRFCENVAK